MKSAPYPSLPVLLVDDDPAWLRGFTMTLNASGINNVMQCEDSREVAAKLVETPIGMLVLDLTMPHLSGQEILRKTVEDYPDLPVIVVSGVNELETAVDCMRDGAFDYFVKTTEKERLVAGVHRAVELLELRKEHALLKKRFLDEHVEHPEAFEEILTCSGKMQNLFRYIETIAPSTHPVQISGETGVGKELFAKAVHELSRCDGPFVPVNAAGLDDHVFSDTLFGHKKGAFTGADAPRPGLIEQASGGTLFLDEIGDLKMESQVKLLRLLQEREYYPLGSDVAKKSTARIIVATNRNLKRMCETGEFRKDLYYRLAPHRIEIPPLRERKEDLPLLLDCFLEDAAESLGRNKPAIPKELHALLATYYFPGNVREFKAMVLEALSHHGGGVLSMDLFKKHILTEVPHGTGGAEGELPAPPLVFGQKLPTLKQSADLLVQEALDRAKGNQAIAAQMLGISRQALNRRLRQES